MYHTYYIADIIVIYVQLRTCAQIGNGKCPKSSVIRGARGRKLPKMRAVELGKRQTGSKAAGWNGG